MSRNPCRHKEVQSHRRRQHPDLHIDHHDDTQVDRIDSQLHRDWKQDRRHDQQNRRRLHKVTGDQQQDINNNQKTPGRQAPLQNRLSDRVWNPLGRQHMRKQHRIGDNE